MALAQPQLTTLGIVLVAEDAHTIVSYSAGLVCQRHAALDSADDGWHCRWCTGPADVAEERELAVARWAGELQLAHELEQQAGDHAAEARRIAESLGTQLTLS